MHFSNSDFILIFRNLVIVIVILTYKIRTYSFWGFVILILINYKNTGYDTVVMAQNYTSLRTVWRWLCSIHQVKGMLAHCDKQHSTLWDVLVFFAVFFNSKSVMIIFALFLSFLTHHGIIDCVNYITTSKVTTVCQERRFFTLITWSSTPSSPIDSIWAMMFVWR